MHLPTYVFFLVAPPEIFGTSNISYEQKHQLYELYTQGATLIVTLELAVVILCSLAYESMNSFPANKSQQQRRISIYTECFRT